MTEGYSVCQKQNLNVPRQRGKTPHAVLPHVLQASILLLCHLQAITNNRHEHFHVGWQIMSAHTYTQTRSDVNG